MPATWASATSATGRRPGRARRAARANRARRGRRRREHDSVAVVGGRVGDLAVQPADARSQSAVNALSSRASGRSLVGTRSHAVAASTSSHRRTLSRSNRRRPSGLDRAAAERDHRSRLASASTASRRPRDSRNAASPSRSEDLRDRVARVRLDPPVDVDERPADAHGDLRAERRLAGAHEADEGDVAF